MDFDPFFNFRFVLSGIGFRMCVFFSISEMSVENFFGYTALRRVLRPAVCFHWHHLIRSGCHMYVGRRSRLPGVGGEGGRGIETNNVLDDLRTDQECVYY